MAAHLIVIAGPSRCGKTARLLHRYRGVLAENVPAAALWLAPTWRAAAELRGRLLDDGCEGCFSPAVMTFEQFAKAVLEAAPEVIRPISRLMKRQLVRHLIDDQLAAERLKHFRPLARTGGLIDLICELIGELKRLEIWPDDFYRACNARGLTAKDVELFEIYERYQQCLREHQLYDAEGRFWSARRLLQQGQQRPFERLRLVVADGFTDFTRTQHEILEILATRVEEISISLPLEAEPRRSDLFTKPLKTLSELRRRHPQLALEELSRPDDSTWPAMAHLERMLFTNPRQARPAADTAGVEILAAARRSGEIELIASRIKRLLLDGRARPGEIAVVFRSPQDAVPLVHEVFGGLGIPVALESGQTLDRSGSLAALAGLLRLDVEDWPFRGLLAVLGSNYFQPDWPPWQQGATAVAVEQAIRRLQIPRDRERLMQALDDEAFGDDVRSVLRQLAAALDALPQQATPAQWAMAWQQLAEETGLFRAIEQTAPGDSFLGLPDQLAWTRLMDAFDSAESLAGQLQRQPPRWDRREALAAVLDILASECVADDVDESGRVRVLSAASARALHIPYLFLAGLSEKAFPPPDREDRLYGEAEYQRLIEEGLPLIARTERNREEMLLFYEVMTRATRRLYLSYPALDESAQPLPPSPYLSEVEQACGAGRIRRTELTDLSPLPAGDEPLSAAEFRLSALSTALQGNVSLLAGLLRHGPTSAVAENLHAGLQMTHARQDRNGFGPAEGILSGDAARAQISGRFASPKTFSPTELEQYAACPYRFFLERVLQLEPLEELVLEVDYLERGRLAHEALATFHRRVNEVLGRPASPAELDLDRYERLRDETLRELFDAEASEGVQAIMQEINRRLLVLWMADYRRQHEEYDQLWKQCDVPPVPEFFEISFGRDASGETSPSTDRPLELAAGDRTIRIAGRIDRIDTATVAGQAVFNVLDYKTGGSVRFNPAAVAAGTALQLPLYAMAVEQVLLSDRHAVGWQAGYWYLKDNGFRPRQALKMATLDAGQLQIDEDWKTLRRSLVETVAALVRGISAGQFPVCSSDDQCTGRCPYQTVCRINQIRSLGKTWQPADN